MVNRTALALLAAGVTLLALSTASQAQRPGGARMSPSAVFDRLDSNGDGVLTRGELRGRERVLQAFDIADSDGNAELSYDEFQALLSRASGRGGGRGGRGGATPPGRPEQPTPPAPTPAAPAVGGDPATARPVAVPQGDFDTITREVKFGRGRSAVPAQLTFPLGDGPFPVVVFSPYLAGQEEAYEPLNVFLAEHGYVVLTVRHDESVGRMSQDGGGRDAMVNWRERPEDITAVLDSLPDLERQERRLDGKLDYDAVGVSGHLIGAFAASLMAGAETTSGETWRDPGVAAALLLAPQGTGAVMAAESWEDIDVPMMVLTGTELPSRRTGNPPEWRTEPFQFASPPDKYLVYVQGMDGRFGGLFAEGGTSASRFTGVANEALESYVLASILSFWDAHLRGDAGTLADLRSERIEVESNGVAQMSTQPGVLDDGLVTGGERPVEGFDYEPLTGTYPVGDERLTLFDSDRRREVPVRIFAPAATPAEGGGWPVVVFSHGLGESRDAYEYLGQELAANGYAVVFMNHEGSDADVAKRRFQGLNSVDNAQQKTADAHFVIDQVVADSIDSELLRGRMDTGRLVAAGQCAGSSIASVMGGLTAQLPGGKTLASRDDRISAVMLLGPQVPLALAQPSRAGKGDGADMLQPDSWSGIDLPLLVLGAERDFMWYDGVRRNPRIRVTAYDTAQTQEKYLVDLAGGAHHAFTDSRPWYPSGPRDPDHHRQISAAVIAFLDAYVDGNDSALAWLQDETLERDYPGKVSQEFVSRRAPSAPFPGSGGEAPAPRPMPPVVDEDWPEPEVWDGKSLYAGERGPYRYEAVERLDLNDRVRGKSLQLRVTYPVSRQADSFPVIVFSHGAWATNEHYQPLVEHWASHGYIVIQPNHRDSAALGTRERDQSVFRDWRERPEDVHFILDSLDEIEKRVDGVDGRMDRERIGVGGHSYGAHTAQLAGGTRILDYRTQQTVDLGDDRVRAALLLSPQGRGDLLDESSWNTLRIPVVVLTGSNDPGRGGGVDWRIDPFIFAQSDEKYLVFIDGAYHDFGGATGGTMSGSRAHPDADIERYTISATTAFWDAHLKDSPEAASYLRTDALERLSDGEVTVTQSEAEGERLAAEHRGSGTRSRSRPRRPR